MNFCKLQSPKYARPTSAASVTVLCIALQYNISESTLAKKRGEFEFNDLSVANSRIFRRWPEIRNNSHIHILQFAAKLKNSTLG